MGYLVVERSHATGELRIIGAGGDRDRDRGVGHRQSLEESADGEAWVHWLQLEAPFARWVAQLDARYTEPSAVAPDRHALVVAAPRADDDDDDAPLRRCHQCGGALSGTGIALGAAMCWCARAAHTRTHTRRVAPVALRASEDHCVASVSLRFLSPCAS